MAWPVGVALMALVVLGGGLLRHAGAPGESASSKHGVWQVLGDGLFNSPVGLAADRTGNLYVVDGANHHVVKLAPDGSVLATFGSHGSGAG